ncbi:hypothetical protein LI148_05440 [Colidextribacter sp. 210702-DFI.3.9]|nr:hypothetical protein [Colidextribacter sp. 210702-DFI.3.9]
MLLDEKTRSRIQLKIRNGCGQGEGKDYKPWIRVGEFSSSGTSYRIPYYKQGGRSGIPVFPRPRFCDICVKYLQTHRASAFVLNYGQRNKNCYDGIVRRQDTAISEISPLEVVNADTGNELHLIFGTVPPCFPCFPCFLFIVPPLIHSGGTRA